MSDDFFKRMSQKKRQVLSTVILAVVFGLAAGVVGQIVVSTYIFTPGGPLEVGNYTAEGENIIIQSAKKVVIEQSVQMVKSREMVAPSLVDIYLVENSSADSLSSLYFEDQARGQGLILTSDGWVMTNARVISQSLGKYVVMDQKDRLFEVSEIVSDPLTDIVFLKIITSGETLNNLPVVKLGRSRDLRVGDPILVLAGERMITTFVEDLDFHKELAVVDLVQSTEEFRDFILLQDELSKDYQAAPLVNLAGEVVGLVQTKYERSTAVPVDYLGSVIYSLLREGALKRPFLGIKYLDLSEHSAFLAAKLTQGRDKGALLYDNVYWGIKAIDAKSPAELAELVSGDIILEIDGRILDQDNHLNEIIQGYQAGETIEVLYLRDGVEQIVEVELAKIRLK